MDIMNLLGLMGGQSNMGGLLGGFMGQDQMGGLGGVLNGPISQTTYAGGQVPKGAMSAMGTGPVSSQVPSMEQAMQNAPQNNFWDFSLGNLWDRVQNFDVNERMADPAFQVGLGLLGSTKGNEYQAISQGLLGSQQQAQAQAERQREEEQRKATEETLKQAQQAAMQGGNVPAWAVPLMGNPETAKYGFGAIPNASATVAPSSVREYEYFSTLPQDQQKAYLSMKRAAQFQDVGGVPNIYDPVSGGLRPMTSAEMAAANERRIAEEKARGGAVGKAGGEAAVNLPSSLQGAQQALDLIQQMKVHPGREAATGFSSIGNFMALPGSETRDFLTMEDQLRGKVFLEAYAGLKGGGQITEVEGKKAEQAVARLNSAQSEEAYLQALNDLESVILEGMKRAQQKAGVTAMPAAQQTKNITVDF